MKNRIINFIEGYFDTLDECLCKIRDTILQEL